MNIVPDPYRLLGLSRAASDEEIKAAHRRLAKRYHPDAPEADTRRFLAVQEAYQLLADPLRRREWDTRHSSGPVRASDPTHGYRAGRGGAPRSAAEGGTQRRRTTATGAGRAGGWRGDVGPDGTKRQHDAASQHARGDEADTDGARTAGPGRDPSARTYTWSAEGVPWWEDAGRRQAGNPGRASPPEEPTTSGPGGVGERGGAEGTAGAPPSFDVYNRSSGAAWSSAARAHFRRGDAELPRRGVFGRPRTGGTNASGWAPGAGAAAGTGGARFGTGPQRNAGGPGWETNQGAWTRSETRPPPSDAPAAAPPGHAAHATRAAPGPELGTRRSEDNAYSRALRRRAVPWPTLAERLVFATVAWLPLALLIAYGGGAATGCDRAAASCPRLVEPLQLTTMLGALLAFVAIPRAAYIASWGTLTAVVSAFVLVAITGLLRTSAPLSGPLVIVGTAILATTYALGALWASRDGPTDRPWLRRPGRARVTAPERHPR